MSLNLAFSNGSPADATAVSAAIQKHWAGTHGMYDVTINTTDPSAPTYRVTFKAENPSITSPVHGLAYSYGPGRGGEMTLWSPSGNSVGISSEMIGHEFGHASHITQHSAGNDIMNSPVPRSAVTDPSDIGDIMASCDAQRTDTGFPSDQEKAARNEE